MMAVGRVEGGIVELGGCMVERRRERSYNDIEEDRSRGMSVVIGGWVAGVLQEQLRLWDEEQWSTIRLR